MSDIRESSLIGGSPAVGSVPIRAREGRTDCTISVKLMGTTPRIGPPGRPRRIAIPGRRPDPARPLSTIALPRPARRLETPVSFDDRARGGCTVHLRSTARQGPDGAWPRLIGPDRVFSY